MRLAYFVHDLNDAAVARRVAMLRAADVDVQLAGFWRGERAPSLVSGVRPAALGQTHDARLTDRALSVLRRLATPSVIREIASGADVVMARNLEMLTLVASLPRGPRLVYECLDIHRTLLGDGPRSSFLRHLERRWLARADLLLISSPAFLTRYFEPRQCFRGRALLVENKVLRLEDAAAPSIECGRPAGPPWKIGWFGMLRCRRSLALLTDLARTADGAVEVILRGKPALHEFSDFPGLVRSTPNLRFEGPYGADDLEGIYRQVHFNWTIDYFEAGLNSEWLLPNRIYEGSLYGATPIARSGVQAAAWLAEHDAGLILADPARDLGPAMAAMTPTGFAGLHQAVAAIPRGDLVFSRKDAQRLAKALGAPAPATSPPGRFSPAFTEARGALGA